jgi:anti-sigma B factor antagonist
MDIRFDQENDIIIVNLHGKLETNTVDNLELELSQYMDVHELKVLCDLSALDYFSSAGMQLLLKLAQNIKENNGHIVFCSPQDFIREAFDIVGFNRILQIVDTREDALVILRQATFT